MSYAPGANKCRLQNFISNRYMCICWKHEQLFKHRKTQICYNTSNFTKKLKLYYSAGWPEGKSGKDGIVIVTGAETERTGIQFPHLPVGGWSKHTFHSDSITVRWSLNLQLVTCSPSRATPQTLRLFTWEIRAQQPMCPRIRNSAFLQ